MRLPWEIAGKTRFERWIAPITIGALVGLVAFLLVLFVRSPRDAIVLEVSRQSDPDQISVWVGGEVAKPGLYQLQRGSRVADAIAAAGGLNPGANASGLSMAGMLSDADEIVVPASSAAVQAVPVTESSAPNPTTAPASDSTTNLININTADASELEELPGVGPAIAGRIIEYRNAHGGFTTVDELEAVSGISARMVDEFRPFITVGQ